MNSELAKIEQTLIAGKTSDKKEVVFASEIAENKNVVNTHAPQDTRIKRQILPVQTDQLNITNNGNSAIQKAPREFRSEASAVQEENGDFVPVISRKKRRQISNQKNIFGKAKIAPEASFAAFPRPRKAWFYLGKVKQDTTEDIITNYISSKVSNQQTLTIEKLPTKGTTQSFKIGIHFDEKDVLLSEDFWPEGVIVRRFNFPRSSFRSVSATPNAT